MDIKHVLFNNPLDSAYVDTPLRRRRPDRGRCGCSSTRAGSSRSGTTPTPGRFAFDNESPRHKVYLEPFRIADRLVTAGEWLEFMARRRLRAGRSCGSPTAGTRCRSTVGTRRCTGATTSATAGPCFTLGGWRPVDPNEPVVHVSHYEADAFARWSRRAAPTEFEWEHAVESRPRRSARPARLRAASRAPASRARAPAAAGSCRRSATCGSGRRARTCPTRGSRPRPARSVSTTASS